LVGDRRLGPARFGVAVAAGGLLRLLQLNAGADHANAHQRVAHSKSTPLGELGVEGGVTRGVVKAANHPPLARLRSRHRVAQRRQRAGWQIDIAAGKPKFHHAALHQHAGVTADRGRGGGWRRDQGRCACAAASRLGNGQAQSQFHSQQDGSSQHNSNNANVLFVILGR